VQPVENETRTKQNLAVHGPQNITLKCNVRMNGNCYLVKIWPFRKEGYPHVFVALFCSSKSSSEQYDETYHTFFLPMPFQFTALHYPPVLSCPVITSSYFVTDIQWLYSWKIKTRRAAIITNLYRNKLTTHPRKICIPLCIKPKSSSLNSKSVSR
jgi:hypothetical protein